MRACANGERSTAACRAFATGSRSSMKRPSPRSSASSSRRGSGRPTHGSRGRPSLPRAYLTIALWPGSATIFASCSRAFAPGRRARTTRSSGSPRCRIATSASRVSTSIASFARARPRPFSRRARRPSRSRDLRRAARGRRGQRARRRGPTTRRARGARGRRRRARRTPSRAASGLRAASRSRAGSSSWSRPARPTARSCTRRGSARSSSGRPSSCTRTSGSRASTGSRPALPDLERADCVVVVAGMDGALASVVGGLAHGAGDRRADERRLRLGARRGDGAQRDALLVRGGLAVVGIDDGLGAGTIAARIARGRE